MADRCMGKECKNNALWELNYPGVNELLCPKHLGDRLTEHPDFDYHITRIDVNSPFDESITVFRLSPTHFSLRLSVGEKVTAAIIIDAAGAIRLISALQRGICEMIRISVQDIPRSGKDTHIVGKRSGNAYFEPDI